MGGTGAAPPPGISRLLERAMRNSRHAPARAGAGRSGANRGRAAPRAARKTARPGSVILAPREILRLHWSGANRFPGAVWPASELAIGLAAPFALVVRYAGFPGAWPPVWLPLLDPLIHAATGVALVTWFCRRQRLDAWHLGLDRQRIDTAAGWTLGILCLALAAAVAALTDPVWIDAAPELFAPALALARAGEFEPGRGTRLASVLFLLGRAGIVGPVQEIILTGLVYPTVRRRWPVPAAAPVCAALGALLHAQPTECGVDPCLWPALQAAAAQAAASLFSALAYERFRTLWIPLLWQAGFVVMRMAPGLPAALGL